MTVESLYDSIDWEHMDNITNLHFVRVLVDFPHHRLEPRKKRLQPLSTNSEQQMENKGYQAGFRDFDEQMGIEPEKCDDLLSWNRADGGGHATLMRQKMIQVTTKDIYASYRNAISTPETWHTKSTQLNSAAANHYGPAASPDPSSLSRSSNAANMKRPTDLKKCDFYPTSRSMSMIWDARVLDCWRTCRPPLFAHIDDLLEQASILRERYASQAAYEQALDKAEQDGALHRSKFPMGSAENDIDTEMPGLNTIPDIHDPAEDAAVGAEPSAEIPTTPEPKDSNAEACDAEEGPKVHKEPPGFNGDRILGNSILFLMEFGWWIELNYAIPEGDVGRVFEILKVHILYRRFNVGKESNFETQIFIFTFAGSSNQNYTKYMLDLYALLEFECSPELKEALLNNWLMTLRGEIGTFIEGDIMQEWNNRWLTQISGQRGGDFDDKFYRKTIAPNVLHFLQIKEDIESAFDLKRRSKSHPSPHLRDEIKILLQLYQEEELHSFRSGRSMGHAAVNQFDRGYQRLEDSKLAEYLQHSAEYAELLREMEVLRDNIPAITVRSPSSTSSSELDENWQDRSSSPMAAQQSNPPSPVPDRNFHSPAPSSCRSPTASNCSSSSTTQSFRSSASAQSRLAADCVEEWDIVDHSNEHLFSGSDLTVTVDPDTGRLSDDWYEPEEFEALVERLCGPELQEEESENEEPESDEPETESEGEDPEDD
ncbi:hypothetical protein B0H17DRAFT_1140257 [Mycena rosella]|uniref:DUF6589 domain-containing protein n=1 Tax=Mycena rosella TaxID=1033263 RepID=A0AAD7D2H7_MYCRO|nr:hypothetical protein B0H17DRAFT_1140257 [Mycena rosella]